MGGEPRTRTPTSFDVARAAGVSRSTVSRTFTPGARVSPEVRARVLDAAEALGYRVNALARGLQARHSRLVGIVASRLDTPFRALQVRCLAQNLLREGLDPLLLVADRGEDIRALIQNILSYSVSGVIVTSDTPAPEVVEACNRAGVPLVMINRGPASDGADTVCMDLEAGGRAAFEMLRAGGVARFALLAPAERTWSVTGRAEAFLACCRARGLSVTIIESADQSHAAGTPPRTRSRPPRSGTACRASSAPPTFLRSACSTGSGTSAGSAFRGRCRSWASTTSHRRGGARIPFRLSVRTWRNRPPPRSSLPSQGWIPRTVRSRRTPSGSRRSRGGPRDAERRGHDGT
jgi:hypothetical protein